MKKVAFIVVILLTVIFFCYNANAAGLIGNQDTIETKDYQGTISKKIIRFHVIANSDTTQDQAIKIKVKDSVIKYMYPKISKCKNIDESREILKKEDNNIKKIACDILRQSGFNYTVKTTLDHENFPVKTYGNITLSQGNYEAYRIIIGNGNGHNWWCVMFPPLCFIDVSKGEVSDKQVEKTMESTLSKDEYSSISNTGKKAENTEKKDENKIEYKFKVVEWGKKLIKIFK